MLNPSVKSRCLRGLVFLVSGLALSFITRNAPVPENTHSLVYALPAFVIFILFIVAMFSLGAIIRKVSRVTLLNDTEAALFDLATGSISFYLLSYALVALHLFSSAQFYLLWIILAVFTAFGIEKVNFRGWFGFAKTKAARWLLAFPALIIVIRLIEGLQFHQHGDSYAAYLVGSRLLTSHGDFHDFMRLSSIFIATSWESLYAWGTALMSLQGGHGLDLTQIFAQWCTGGVGMFGVLLATLSFCIRFAIHLPISSTWFALISVATLQVQALRWTANLAKHDIGVSFWAASALFFAMFLLPGSGIIAFIIGLVIGTATIGKLTVSLLAICIGVRVLIKDRRNTLWFVLGCLIAVSPILIRNFLQTQNPVFPWMVKTFKTEQLSDTLAGGVSVATNIQFLPIRFWEFVTELQHQFPLWPALILIWFFVPVKNTVLRLIAIPVISTLLFILIFRSPTEVRYHNANLILMAFVTTFFAFYIAEKLFVRLGFKRWSPLPAVALAFFILSTSNITLFTFAQIGSKKFAPISERLKTLDGGEAKLWLRSNAAVTDPILSIGDPHLYYLVDYPVTEVIQSKEWDRKMRTLDAPAFAHALVDSPFRFAYFENDITFFAHLKLASETMQNPLKWKTECKKLDRGSLQLWDLDCVRKN